MAGSIERAGKRRGRRASFKGNRGMQLGGNGTCSCGDLDREASLIVARRAPLVVATLALFSFLTA